MRYPLFIILMLLAVSCDKEHIMPDNPRLVVEGWIEDGGYPVVILTENVRLNDRFQESSTLSDYVIRWAKVSVTDGQDTVVLTGKHDKGYFPPYIYTTSRIKGEAGKTYTLMVEYEQFHATATTSIPRPVPIDTFHIRTAPDADTTRQVSIVFSDQPEEKDYYQLFARVGGKNKQFLASYMGSLDDETLSDTNEIPIYRGHHIGFYYTPYFSSGDTIAIRLAHIDKTTFEFWDSYIKTISLDGNMLFRSNSTVKGNVQGGYGCWYGMGTSTRYLILP